MISDKDLAGLCVALYGYAGAAVVPWDHYDLGDDDGVCWALKRIGDAYVIVLRGSTVIPDWVHDLETWVTRIQGYEIIGDVHHGMSVGIARMWKEAKALIPEGAMVYVTGHSLGAGRACQLTGLMVADGRAPVARVCFGEPRPGFQALADFIKDVPARSYRNAGPDGHDLITDVPEPIPGLLPYVHPCELTDVTALPSADDEWGLFSYHHVQLYAAALSET